MTLAAHVNPDRALSASCNGKWHLERARGVGKQRQRTWVSTLARPTSAILAVPSRVSSTLRECRSNSLQRAGGAEMSPFWEQTIGRPAEQDGLGENAAPSQQLLRYLRKVKCSTMQPCSSHLRWFCMPGKCVEQSKPYNGRVL